MAGGTQRPMADGAVGSDFSARLVDQFFRRWFWYVLPVVLLAAVGVRAAAHVSEQYVSKGVLSASANPLVATPEIRGTTIGAYEAPAVGIARLINEQLRSDAFVEGVAARAGIESALQSGVITPDIIRQQVGAAAQGENLLSVQAAWSDPETAFLLVEATINNYLDLIADTVTIDSIEAISFWTDVREQAQVRADAAERDLRTFTATLPELADGEELSTVQELDLSRFNATLDSALADVSDAQDRIDAAELSVEQSKSQAGRQVRAVDPPTRASAPEPATVRRLSSLLMFTLIGVLISSAALVMTTLLDHSIRSVAQLRAATHADSTAVVPQSKAFRHWPSTNERAA